MRIPNTSSWRPLAARLALLLLAGLAGGAALASPYADGRALYAEGDFAAAAEAFKAAVAEFPDEARHHLWLGRAYGRMAERAGWWRAVRLAGKTRAALERAVELDPDDVSALQDLADYYASAPQFLGGSPDRAAELRRRIGKLGRYAGQDAIDEG